ncbi:MAG: DNA starvation/stationary phase protection protein [Flavobacteriales bacterium]|nr:DNA starvation/stationary phase protection protein [Flavobacteriales bacterium]
MKISEKYISDLNQLLSTYQVHYQNLRALHWNIQGEKFFELHLKYEELYNATLLTIDELAERILTLGGRPLSTFTDYISESVIKENTIITEGNKGMQYILDAQKQLLVLERALLKASSEIEDEGTNAFLSDLIRVKEKTNWMFNAWLGNSLK